ncbi:BZ3500_MvSof-1268-A1-R1_Chr1-3g01622 [Microbotryum saponariae]|uniref:BZ3500_MvSof-1268-A1-R1_Chr1-3g01622 protein n=1 Tax=Microbotryum saponariae TaxID=289078 RepID=A0A2X0M6G0_9BASI|nr:BZ3500_MvSof-1268-A1-R1_Chr1-3g01622 [Microbotryum saponariae]SCZ94168.1 BZ3501_MvSof-1269-A2-R1_Chr1-3g01223 [Microbotryum saponariae]
MDPTREPTMVPMEIGEPSSPGVALSRNRVIQISAACGLVVVLALSSLFARSDRPLHETAATWRDHLVKGWNSGSQGSTVVWAGSDVGLSQRMFAEPNNNYRATFIHAVVRSNADTYRKKDLDYDLYVSLAMHIEVIPYHSALHQLTSTDPSIFTIGVACEHEFAGQFYSVEGWQHDLAWITVVNCPVPTQLEEAMSQNRRETLNTTLTWTYKEDKGKFAHSLSLKAHYPEPESEFGICLSPIWGHLNARATLEWRENAHRLGVDTVHWHARDTSVAEWVRRYNSVTGAKDTFMYAPPTSLETYGQRKNLADNGLYGDQVIYYNSCKFRSHQLYPTRWLGYLDRDEDFFPKILPPTMSAATRQRLRPEETMLRTLLPDYFANVAADIGSVCLEKAYHGHKLDLDDVVPPKVASTAFPELGYAAAWIPPELSHKCMHRLSPSDAAKELADDCSGHGSYGEGWYPGFHQVIHDNVTSAAVPFYFWHQLAHDAGSGDPPPYKVEELKRYIGDLWIERERIWDGMHWGCDSLPCRF